MGYNGNNRGYSRRRNGHRGAYKSGEKLIGNTIIGLLGLGAMAANGMSNMANNAPQPQSENEPSGLGCLIPAALILVPLNIIGLMIGGFPLIGEVAVFVLGALLYGDFKECALSVKKLPTYGKVLFWVALTAFSLACSYWIFGYAGDIGSVIPCRGTDGITDEVCWHNLLDFELWLIGGAFPLAACVIGYLAGVHKAKKQADCTHENSEKP